MTNDVVQFVPMTQNSIETQDPTTAKTVIQSNVSPAALAAQFGAGNVRVANANFNLAVNGTTVAFRAGESFVTNAALNAALAAANAPVT
ncbi:hypothetical protein [Paraburkholderia terrae]|uniref:hypothetical protein n=1 Tax=Paraburkholderia terrae TaxID=311230 RepID=UPI0020512269|nr:hypothetical protein [Paraburkholderia terrae]BDC38933.1 hypothetical protein PTKU15_22300 [Paraburkholderia terrae]